MSHGAESPRYRRWLLTALVVAFSASVSASVPPVLPSLEITVQAGASSATHWILPGPRALEESVFGTPQAPLGFEPDVGVPVSARGVSSDGLAFTKTLGPTAHADASKPIRGTLSLRVLDVSAVDAKDSRDEVRMVASFTSPDGAHEYRVVVNRVIPVGPVHPFFGGVVTNAYLHGGTGIGTKLQPRQFVYAAFWGVGALYVDGQLVAPRQIVHGMLSQRVRTSEADGYRLVSSAGVDRLSGRQFHLILPPLMATPSGPKARPVPSALTLPNGSTQPFIHIMFDDVDGVVAKAL